MRTPKVRSAAGGLFWMGVRGGLPLTSISYTSKSVRKREGMAHHRHDPAEFGNARSRHRVSIPSGVAGTNLRKTTHYEGKNCDPLQNCFRRPSRTLAYTSRTFLMSTSCKRVFSCQGILDHCPGWEAHTHLRRPICQTLTNLR